MADIKEVVRKMQGRKAYPSDTEYFFGLTKEENDVFPHPFPPIAQCDVTVHPGGAISFSRKPSGNNRVLTVSPGLFINAALNKAGLSRDNVKIVWTD